MVKKLRNKFVIVTMTLMITLFGGFLVINTIYTNYWNSIEISEMLEWISYSGIFTSHNEDTTNEELILDITKDESPIAGVLVDQKGCVLDTSVIGKEQQMEIPNDVLDKMCQYKESKIKVGRYYYSYAELTDGNILLVIMNPSANKHVGVKRIGVGLLILCGILLLFLIAFRLSKFVTTPAEETLLREKRFISDASHELKTPLGAISINAQALEMEFGNNLYIKNIISESQRMSRLIERLLVLSKYDEEEYLLQKNICLSDLCEEMSLTYESVAFEKGIAFQYEIEADIYMEGDEDEIRQLLAILIDNAIKNTDCFGNVEIKCFSNRKHKHIVVSNTGQGILKEDLPHVFERFYTSDLSRERSSFGLGLAIAKSITERHKGIIKAESVPNEVTTFQVLF